VPRTTLAALVSPRAGGGRGALVGAAVLGALRDLGLDVVDVTGPTAAASLTAARAALAGGARALVTVGGDGAVQLGASAVAGTPVPLVVVPAGSGNDAARALGVRAPRGRYRYSSLAQTVAAQLTARVRGRPVDLLQVHPAGGGEPRWCVSVLSAGFDAAVNARANTWAGARGAAGALPPRARYTAAVLRELPAWRPRPYRLVLDGTVLTTEAVLVAVANTTSYGGGLRIAPGARPDDGLADVVVVRALSRPALLALLPTVFAGWHTRHPAVTVHRAARVEVALLDEGEAPGAAPLVVHGDGEPMAALPVACEVAPGALRLLA
jgi:diacylglycerol kinase (ATP)